MAEDASELQRLQEKYDAHLKQCEKWKQQVKAMSMKDKGEIVRLKQECDLLTHQVTNMGAIAREKDSTIRRLRNEAEEVREKASSITSMQQALSHALEAKETALSQLKKKEAEVAAQRERSNNFSGEVAALRVELTGSDYLEGGIEALTLHKTVTHSASTWVLCSIEGKPRRWFEGDSLVARFGADVLERCPESDQGRPKIGRDDAGEQARVRELLASLEAAREEIKRLSKSKQDEVRALRDRVEELERVQETTVKTPQEDKSGFDCCRAEVEAQLKEEHRAMVEGQEEQIIELLTQLRQSEEENKRVVDEFTQYRKRVIRTQSNTPSGVGDPVGLTVAADIERLRAERTNLKQRVAEFEDSIASLTKRLSCCTSEKEALSKQLEQACETVEESERGRHCLRQELRAAEAAAEQRVSMLQRQLDELREKLAEASLPRSPPPPSRGAPQVCADCKRLKHSLAEERTAHAATRTLLIGLREKANAVGQNGLHAAGPGQPAQAAAPPPTPPAIVVTPTSPLMDSLSLSGTPVLPPQDAEAPKPSDRRRSALDDKELRQLLDELDDQAGFDVDDLVAVAAEQAERQELAWCAQRLKRALRELKEAKAAVEDLRHAADQNRSLRAQVSDLRTSLKRQDSAQSLDYVKSTVVNFCRAKDQPEVQAALVPLLSTLLSLTEEEKAALFQLYPLQ